MKITNAELEDVEIVISPTTRCSAIPIRCTGWCMAACSSCSRTFAARGVAGAAGAARKTIRDRKIKFFVIDAFAVAKQHAPTPELETRMMGIAFIGAVCGNFERVTEPARRQEAVLNKIREQIAKKFGAKGGAGRRRQHGGDPRGPGGDPQVDYDDARIRRGGKATAHKSNSPSRSRRRCAAPAAAGGSAGFLDAEYFDEVMGSPFRDGTIAEAPVLPGTGLFIPAGSAALKDKGLFRRNVPEFIADLCTGCMECALVCPDAAIPNTVHDFRDLLTTAISSSTSPRARSEALRREVYPIADAAREVYRNEKRPPRSMRSSAGGRRSTSRRRSRAAIWRRLANALATFPVAKTRPFFDAMEKAHPGSGGLYSATIDPWKCTGCLECIDVCGPHALVARDQDEALLDTLQTRFDFLSRLPNTPARYTEGAVNDDGDTKRLMLDRNNYYATTGGHGACRGCGEVTAIRLVTSTNHAIHD